MNLLIALPDNLITDSLLMQKRIPCRCRVEVDFEISIAETIPESSGKVDGWDATELDLRVPPYVGGTVSHDASGMITLKKVHGDVYEIVDLEMFNRGFGWCPVVVDGAYAPPGDFWDEEVQGGR